MNTPHTPGPWEASQAAYPRVMSGNIMICKTDCSISSGKWIESSETAIANAHLIAAAPELLRALERLTESVNDTTEVIGNYRKAVLVGSIVCTKEMIEQAQQAIAKAKGNQ